VATVYVDPAYGNNGAGSFADPKNTWVGITWTASNVYLQKESTTFSGSASISPSQNDIIFGTYDAATGDQIQDNTRHATITNSSGQGINCNNRTGLVIDNLKIIANASAGNAIQALYTNSSTALSLTVRRCILSVPLGGACAIRARGDGLTVEDTLASGDSTGSSTFSLTAKNVTMLRTTVTSTGQTAVQLATTADVATDDVNAHIEDCFCNSTASAGATGDGLLIKGKNVTIKRFTSTAAWDNSIILRCQNILVDGCDLSGFDQNRSTGDAIQLAGTHDVLACTIRNVRAIGHTESPVKQCLIVGDSGSGAQTGPVLVEDCYFYGMAFGAILNLPGAVCRRCVSIYGTGGIVASANSVKIQDCLVSNTTGRGMGADGAFTGVEFTGNTLVDIGGSCIGPGATIAPVIKNNVIVSASGGSNVQIYEQTGTSVLTNNRYFVRSGSASWIWNNASQSTLSAWKSASSQDAISTEGDPLLSPSYRPMAASPILGAGTHLGYTRDLDKKQRQNPPCIGAYDAATMISG
jgi:hypothetical protein